MNNPFDTAKTWLSSDTIRGSLLALAALAAMVFKVGDVINGPAIFDAVMQALTALGSVWAIFGRFKATTKVTLTQSAADAHNIAVAAAKK